MLSCRNHASILSKVVALRQLAIHIVEHNVKLDVKYRRRVTNINRACRIVVRSGETTDTKDTTLAFLGYVNQRYNMADTFGVSGSWLVNTGCPNDHVSEEQAQGHPDCVYDAKTFKFNTTNGDIGSTAKLIMWIPLLRDTISACILPSTPPVLSVGGRRRMRYTLIGSAGKRQCWIIPLGKVVPLSVHKNAPYFEDDTRWVNEAAVLNSVGLNNDEGACSFQVDDAPYDRLTAAAAIRAFDDDTSWAVVVGYDTRARMGLAWASVFRRATDDTNSGKVIEAIWIDEHEYHVHWRQVQTQHLNIISDFFYYGDRREDTTVFGKRSEETTVPRDRSE